MDVRSPLTGKPALLLEEIPTAAFVGRWRETFGIEVAAEYQGEAVVRRCLCPDSQLEFFDPPELAGGGGFYRDLGKFDWYYMPWKWEYGEAVAVLGEMEMRAGGLMEVGCGPGDFLRECGKRGIAAEGLELNEAAVAKARAEGLAVTAEDVARVAERKPGGYDAVAAFQVLEHIAAPLDFLKACVGLLRPGGKLLLSTPDGHGFCGRIPSLDMLLDAPPHHMGKWNGAAYQYLTKVLPLAMVRIRYEPLQDYHLEWYLDSQLAVAEGGDKRLGKQRKKVRSELLDYARRSGCFRSWKGHTILVEFERLDD